jgi:hypothetical protein
LLEPRVVLQFLIGNLGEHRPAEGVLRSFRVLLVEMMLVHLVLQSDLQRIQTWFHRGLLSIPPF